MLIGLVRQSFGRQPYLGVRRVFEDLANNLGLAGSIASFGDLLNVVKGMVAQIGIPSMRSTEQAEPSIGFSFINVDRSVNSAFLILRDIVDVSDGANGVVGRLEDRVWVIVRLRPAKAETLHDVRHRVHAGIDFESFEEVSQVRR